MAKDREESVEAFKAALEEIRSHTRIFNKYHDYPTDAVYIGRGSPWGNPFHIGRDGNRDEVCDRFEREILPTLDLRPLIGKKMVCYCKPRRCHGDSILKELEKLENDENLHSKKDE